MNIKEIIIRSLSCDRITEEGQPREYKYPFNPATREYGPENKLIRPIYLSICFYAATGGAGSRKQIISEKRKRNDDDR